MKLLSIVPAHNEANAIGNVVGQIKALGFDVLVIDDGSIDGTGPIALNFGAQVISTGIKGGKGNALRRGFEYAIMNHYDAVITVDGDGQHDTQEIKNFLEVQRERKAAIVNGNRMHDPQGMPTVRLLTNKFMSWLISMICGQRIDDTQCGYRLITVDVLKNVQLTSTDFEIETELLIKASKAGFRIASVPIKTIYSDEVSKINPLKDTLRFIKFIIKEIGSK